jgi:Uma2 family endonuclease
MTTAIMPPVAPLKPSKPESLVERLTTVMAAIRPGQSLMLTEVRWEEYERLLELREQSGIRVEIDYSKGRLEIMTHGNVHERFKALLGRIVSALCEEIQVPMVLGGNCTIRREELDRGFEPDDWFYIGATATRMMEPTATRALNIQTDPPPDLALEIEISRRLLDRIDLYAAMQIPELWRFDGSRFSIWTLQSNGTYVQTSASRFFPGVSASAIAGCIIDMTTVDDAARLRRFREWVRTLPSVTPKG